MYLLHFLYASIYLLYFKTDIPKHKLEYQLIKCKFASFLFLLISSSFHFPFLQSLATFEYVEPSGKDLGINVRKKVETLVALLNDKDKMEEVRNKAAANREK